MSNPNVNNVLFSSRYQYYLNYDTESGSVSIPATSYISHSTKSYSISIPIVRTNDSTNIKINYSTDSGNWYSFPVGNIILDTNFSITTTGSYSTNNLILTFFIVNQTAATHTNTAVVVVAIAAKFVAP